MTKRLPMTADERAAEIAKLDLLPRREAKKRTDQLVRAMLNSPPEPFTPKVKPVKKSSKK